MQAYLRYLSKGSMYPNSISVGPKVPAVRFRHMDSFIFVGINENRKSQHAKPRLYHVVAQNIITFSTRNPC